VLTYSIEKIWERLVIMTLDISDEVLIGRWLEPYQSGYLSAEGIATQLLQFDEPQIDDVLQNWARDGYLKYFRDNMYMAIPPIWELREKRLVELNFRHKSLIHQEKYDLPDLILAILVSGHIENNRLKGPMAAANPHRAFAELKIYLYKYLENEINDALNKLAKKGMVRQETKKWHNDGLPAVDIQSRGFTYYKKEVLKKMNLLESDSILDINRKDQILLFWAWQADYKTSRNQIASVLKTVCEQINKSDEIFLPLIISTAVDLGDGAVRIDAELLRKIMICDLFVGDITPILIQDDNLYPNPNVLIESGYALASKAPHQIMLIENKRNPVEIDGYTGNSNLKYPFDIDAVHRIAYVEPKDLKKRLLIEVNEIFKKLGFTKY
jgi:hypothetical protein